MWPDGTEATTPTWGRPERLPHDLDHYIVEAAFRPPYGFWRLVEQQAPFSSLTLVKGRWPKDQQAESQLSSMPSGAVAVGTARTASGGA